MQYLWMRLNQRYYSERIGFHTSLLNEAVVYGSITIGVIGVATVVAVIVLI